MVKSTTTMTTMARRIIMAGLATISLSRQPRMGIAAASNILNPMSNNSRSSGSGSGSGSNTIDLDQFLPYGYQSGYYPSSPHYQSSIAADTTLAHDLVETEELDDDSFAGGMFYDATYNLVYFTGSTFGRFFDHGVEDNDTVKDKSGSTSTSTSSSTASAGSTGSDGWSHLTTSDCFFGVLKLPHPSTPKVTLDGTAGASANTPPWLLHLDNNQDNDPATNSNSHEQVQLIYSRRFGTPQHSEACSSLTVLPRVNDALLQKEGQLKLALLGHVNPIPLSSKDASDIDGGTGKFNGGFMSSLSNVGPVMDKGRAYGYIADLDLSLTLDREYTPTNSQQSQQSQEQSQQSHTFSNAFGAFLGGYVLESSPIVYPVGITQNTRDPNQIYIVSMHSDDNETPGTEAVMNPAYRTTLEEEVNGKLHSRPDVTLGGSGGSGIMESGGGSGTSTGSGKTSTSTSTIGGVPKYGDEFYVKVQQLTVVPYETLMDVQPSEGERIKQTLKSGWGFGFKLNDAIDVRPSCIEFVKGKTPDEDLLLLAGTTRKKSTNGGPDGEELDGFVTKLIPPAPTPVTDAASSSSSSSNTIQNESNNPTKRIDSTTGRDETVSFICLPPPNPNTGAITHAFIVGSTTNSEVSASPNSGKAEPSLAYILMMKLDDMSTIWKQRVSAIHPQGMGGNVLGEGCAVSNDGMIVYLSGTMDGGSALNTGNVNIPPSKPIGGTTDVFVVAYDVPFGNAYWGKQLGTVYEDKLARGGGVATDNEGNVMIMGTTRGALQRYRPEKSEMLNVNPASKNSMAADIFFMSLSRTDGSFVNAPYVGPAPSNDGNEGASSGGDDSIASASSGNSASSSGGLSGGGIAGIVITLLVFIAAVAFLVGRHRKGGIISDRSETMWENGHGDDFSVDGGGGGSSFRLGGYRDNFGNSAAAGGTNNYKNEEDGDWDDGNDRINATWMTPDRHSDVNTKQAKSSSRFKAELDFIKSTVSRRGDGSSSTKSTRSTRSRGSDGGSVIKQTSSYSSDDKSDDHSTSSSLRQEANSTMSKMFTDNNLDTTDPRLDDGASIKSLLSHYREVRKNTLFDGGASSSEKSSGGGGAGAKSASRSPSRMKNSAAGTSTSEAAGGLAEFTIV